ncbi:MAG: hypothetical protein HC774_00010 [Sphingomonadales bacterium]|nr:hypothetical protein [Sphingomonadales bacterium]
MFGGGLAVSGMGRSGTGWSIGGLCPGPAIAHPAIAPTQGGDLRHRHGGMLIAYQLSRHPAGRPTAARRD